MSVQDGIGYIRGTFNPNLDLVENSNAYANILYPYIQDDGGNTQNISLTIDIINEDALLPTRNNFLEQDWLTDDRNSGNILLDQLIWGFKETTHSTRDSKALSNAFCFNKQSVTFHIAKQGNTAGYIGEDFLYAKNNVELSVVNVVTGVETVLTTFNELETSLDDENRSVQWVIPNESNSTFSNFGFFGMFVIKIKVTSKLFDDACLKKPSVHSNKISNFYLQLLTYSSAREATDVTADEIEVFSGTTNSDTFSELFTKSVFDDLTQYNQNDLSEDQKRAIIADQIAVLFMSQHPVISSDLIPSKINGFGGEKALQTQKVLERSLTYAERYDPSIINLAQNRLFGMVANYQTFSFADEINNNFTDVSQSAQIIRDPARIIIMDEDATLTDELGIDGILFQPYVIEGLHTEVLTLVPPNDAYTISLYKYSVGIDTLILTNDGGDELDCGEDQINVSFNIVYGEENVSSIYYQVWIKNNLSYIEYEDNSGDSREHDFDFSTIGGITCTFSGLDLTEGDIVTARVSILDTSGFSNVFERKLFMPIGADQPAITELTAFQRNDGSGLIEIRYYYQGVSEIDPADVSLTYSTDNASFSSVSSNVIGDIGPEVAPGYRQIVWNPSTVVSSSTEVLFIKLTLTDVDEKTNTGISSSNTVVIDYSIPELAIRKVSLREEEELIDSSSSSSTSESSFSSDSSSSSLDSSSSSSSSSLDSSSSSSSSSL